MTTITHNWAEHVAFGAHSVRLPASLAEVQDIVGQADRLRVVGARHSFNAIADTAGVLVSLRGLARRIDIDADRRTVTVDGGITYAELCPVLDAAGWALANLASIPDFTVAGAIATATHGSGNTNRNLAAAVAALEIVTADGGRLVLKRGDADFEGAVVGLGALGVVTAITLEIVPRFDIRQSVYHGLGLETLIGGFDAVMGAAYSVSLFSHWNGDLVDQVWIKALADAPAPRAEMFGARPAPGPQSPVMGRDANGTTGQMGVAGPWYDRLPHARIGAIPPIGGEFQSEYFVARDEAPAALAALRAIAPQLHPALIVSEIRTIAADGLWLSMNYRTDSVGLHFSWQRDWARVRATLEVLETALAPFRPRPHWGKLFLTPAADIADRYPRLDDFRNLAARHDPTGKFRNGFLDQTLFGG